MPPTPAPSFRNRRLGIWLLLVAALVIGGLYWLHPQYGGETDEPPGYFTLNERTVVIGEQALQLTLVVETTSADAAEGLKAHEASFYHAVLMETSAWTEADLQALRGKASRQRKEQLAQAILLAAKAALPAKVARQVVGLHYEKILVVS